MTTNKERAVDFLRLVVSGRIDEAYDKYVDMTGRHHNPYFPAGFAALKAAMKENASKFPDKEYEVRSSIGEGDLVAVHGHLIPSRGEKGMVVVHIVRFRGERIVELWDCGEPIPPDTPNSDGAF